MVACQQTATQKRKEESGFREVGLLGSQWHLARHFRSRRRVGPQGLQEWPAEDYTANNPDFHSTVDKISLKKITFFFVLDVATGLEPVPAFNGNNNPVGR